MLKLSLPRVFVGLVIVCSFCLETTLAATADKPNIVLFYVDDLGWSDLGYAGSSYYESPNVDRLASQAVVFDNAYACAPNCAPSRACLMSGMYTPRHGVYTVGTSARGKSSDRKLIPVGNKTVLDPEVVTLPEQLQKLGYRTGHFGKWHLGEDPTTQGMDVNIAGKSWGSPSGGGYHSPFKFPNLEESKPGAYLTDRISEEAVRFIHDNKERPFFLYLAHYSVHTPIQPKTEYKSYFEGRTPDRGHRNAGYAAMVKSMDDSLGRALGALEQLGLDENTVVIFTSDNGGHGGVTSNRPLRGSKGMLYEGGIRVPFVVRGPQEFGASRVVNTPIIGVDLLPTILNLAGATPWKQQPVDGESLLPILRSQKHDLSNRALFWHFPAYLERYRGLPEKGPFRTTPASAIRLGDWKLIRFYESGREELYNVKRDISESRDVAKSHPDVRSMLASQLDDWLERTGAFIPTEPNPKYIGGDGE